MAQWHTTGDGLNRCDLQCFVFGQGWQQPWQSARQQCLARTRWPAEQQVMRTRCRNQQRAFGRHLPLNFIQIRIGFAGVEQPVGNVRFDGCVPIEMRHRLQQMVHCNDLQPRRQASLFGIRLRHHQPAPGLARRQCRRQHPADGPHCTGKRQLPQALHVIQRQRRHLHAGRENPQRNRQIESPAILGQIRRRQIQRDPSRRKLQPRIDDRAAHPVLAFLHRRLGQADHGQRWQTIGQVDFNSDGWRLHADLGAAVYDGEGHGRSLS
ncbi:hypothetical protein D3C86_1200100 [compost metagenome]